MPRQAIPRPPWARRIEPSALSPDQAGSIDLTMSAVREAFAVAGLPGSDAGLEPDRAERAGGAAVLIVLTPSEASGPREGALEPGGAASVVLIRRAGHLRANPGEIAFPGGRVEPGEAPLAAALREALEEVALPAGAVEVLGELSVVHAGRSSVPILPFVAVASVLPELTAHPDEVEAVLVVPLEELVGGGHYWQELWNISDDPGSVMHFFDLGEDVIWGATARMLSELFVRLFSRGSAGRTGAPPGGRTRPAWQRTTEAS